jgi:hypothetical protein
VFGLGARDTSPDLLRPKIVRIDSPESGFFSKAVDYHGIPIKAHAVVENEALYAAYERLN